MADACAIELGRRGGIASGKARRAKRRKADPAGWARDAEKAIASFIGRPLAAAPAPQPVQPEQKAAPACCPVQAILDF